MIVRLEAELVIALWRISVVLVNSISTQTLARLCVDWIS